MGILSLVLLLASPVVATPLGINIMEKQWQAQAGYGSEQSVGLMTVGTDQKIFAHYRFSLSRLEGTDQGGGSILLNISAPADLAGTALLSNNLGPARDEQWIYLPALKLLKRVATTQRRGAFLGSELSYEDLLPPRLGDHSYQLVMTVPCEGEQCYLLESKPMKPSQYAKKMLWVRTDRLTVEKVEYYDKKDELFKRMTLSAYKKIGDRWYKPFHIHVQNLKNRRSTDLALESLTLPANLSAADFTKDKLKP